MYKYSGDSSHIKKSSLALTSRNYQQCSSLKQLSAAVLKRSRCGTRTALFPKFHIHIGRKFRLVLIYDQPSRMEHLTARLFICCLSNTQPEPHRTLQRRCRNNTEARRFVYAKQPATKLERRTLKNDLHI